jgi:hypothetical protein
VLDVLAVLQLHRISVRSDHHHNIITFTSSIISNIMSAEWRMNNLQQQQHNGQWADPTAEAISGSNNSDTEVAISDSDLAMPPSNENEQHHSPNVLEYRGQGVDRAASGVSCGLYRNKRIWITSLLILLIVGAVVGVSLGLTSGSSSSSSNLAPSPAYGGGAPTTSPGPTPSNAYEISDIIESVARFGGQEFEDVNSYQSRARRWVLTQEFPVDDGSALTTEQQAVQLYALACIYYNTYAVRSDWTDHHFGPDVAIPGWFSSRGWLGSARDVCSWYGITCNEDGRVFKIELDTNGLTGSFPQEVAYLHETLNTIDLYNNIVHNSGDAGNAFLGELTNLEYLFLGTTSFEYDGVPTELGKLSLLKELDFSYSLYFGELRGEVFSNLSNLRYLVMDGNGYNSSLPTELVALPQLEYLYAGFSFVEGSLDFVSSMPKIFELWMDDNPGIGGTIPTTIGDSPSLVSLSITNCKLTGTIPTEIGQLTDMIQMWLYDNELTGTIPTEIGNLVKMKILNLQKNDLDGEMPSNVCGRRYPFGRLEELEADCDGEVTCGEECCTCCGVDCIDL